jgi:hypothetical protein
MNNRPVIVLQNRWMKNYRYQAGFPIESSSVIIVRKDHLWSPRIHRTAISGKRALKINRSRIQFRGRHPKLVPKSTPVSVINARGKTVVYKKKGFPSFEKYRTQGAGKQVNKKKVFRYSDPRKRIPTEERREKKYRELQKTKPVYKSFTRRTPKTGEEKAGKQDNRFRKRNDADQRRRVVRKDSPEKKGYKTLQKAQPKKAASPEKSKKNRVKKQEKKTGKKGKKDKTRKKKKDDDK